MRKVGAALGLIPCLASLVDAQGYNCTYEIETTVTQLEQPLQVGRISYSYGSASQGGGSASATASGGSTSAPFAAVSAPTQVSVGQWQGPANVENGLVFHDLGAPANITFDGSTVDVPDDPPADDPWAQVSDSRFQEIAVLPQFGAPSESYDGLDGFFLYTVTDTGGRRIPVDLVPLEEEGTVAGVVVRVRGDLDGEVEGEEPHDYEVAYEYTTVSEAAGEIVIELDMLAGPLLVGDNAVNTGTDESCSLTISDLATAPSVTMTCGNTTEDVDVTAASITADVRRTGFAVTPIHWSDGSAGVLVTLGGPGFFLRLEPASAPLSGVGTFQNAPSTQTDDIG